MKGGLALLCFVGMGVGAQEPPSPSPAQIVRGEIMAGGVQGASHGDLARYRPALLRVYADSTARGLWVADAGLTRQAQALLAELGAAQQRGLRPSDYVAEPPPAERARKRASPWKVIHRSREPTSQSRALAKSPTQGAVSA